MRKRMTARTISPNLEPKHGLYIFMKGENREDTGGIDRQTE
nr:MAG TPA: hypothetical protein [Caudoviricetes sp.]